MDRREFIIGAGLGALALGGGFYEPKRAQAQAGVIVKPNILVIISDDQPKRRTHRRDILPKIFRRMVDGGIDFELGYATTPLCCPNRSTMLSGLYQHNHKVKQNTSGCFNNAFNNGIFNDSVALRMSRVGYRCGYFGKLLQGTDAQPAYVAPGYDVSAWFNWIGTDQDVREWRFNEYGTIKTYPTEGGFAGSSELITSHVEKFIRGHVSEARTDPFYVSVGYLSPHDPYSPEPEYAHTFDNDPLEIYPNMEGLKPGALSGQQEVQEGKREEMQEIDEGVERIYAALEETGQLANTYVIYVSDNGYMLGEHNKTQKDHPWEESVSIPFIVTGPGVPQGLKSRALVGTVDIAPTLLEIAGLDWSDLDGRSLLPVFGGTIPLGFAWRQKMLIESLNRGWKEIRSESYSYMLQSGTTRVYDMTTLDADPADEYQLVNLTGSPEGALVAAEYQPALERLFVCRGQSCRDAEV